MPLALKRSMAAATSRSVGRPAPAKSSSISSTLRDLRVPGGGVEHGEHVAQPRLRRRLRRATAAARCRAGGRCAARRTGPCNASTSAVGPAAAARRCAAPAQASATSNARKQQVQQQAPAAVEQPPQAAQRGQQPAEAALATGDCDAASCAMAPAPVDETQRRAAWQAIAILAAPCRPSLPSPSRSSRSCCAATWPRAATCCPKARSPGSTPSCCTSRCPACCSASA